MNFIWPSLARGTWRFQILPGGDGTGFLQLRTFTVQTHAP